jgi:hypothetical protein
MSNNCQQVTVAVSQAAMSLPPEPSPTWSIAVERWSTLTGGKARMAQGYVSDFIASLHNVITQSRENLGPLLKTGFHSWHLQIVSGTFQTPYACGTDLSYGNFSSSIGGIMEKSPMFLHV